MANIVCIVCGDIFKDAGSHPVICGKKDCVQEAYERGYWKKSRWELQDMVQYTPNTQIKFVKKEVE